MMFDNSENGPTSGARKLGEHLAIGIVIFGAFGAAIGMHFASFTILALGVAHVLLGGLLIGVRSLLARRTADSPEVGK